jgi:Holliday junction resolvasome RuvABC DNA-binding subunit
MIDGLFVEQLHPAEGGLNAVSGHTVYLLLCSNRCREQLLAETIDQALHVRTRFELGDETAYMLAFATPARRRLYDTVKTVPGIGRRSALHVLDCGEPLDTLRAVAANDRAFFRSVPGLGPKKIDALTRVLTRRFAGDLPQPIEMPVSEWVQARDALITEGVPFQDAEQQLRDTFTAAPEARTAERLLTQREKQRQR